MAPHPSRLFAEFIIGPTKPDPVALKRATLPTARSFAALEGGKDSRRNYGFTTGSTLCTAPALRR